MEGDWTMNRDRIARIVLAPLVIALLVFVFLLAVTGEALKKMGVTGK
jgi:hypothetical protein